MVKTTEGTWAWLVEPWGNGVANAWEMNISMLNQRDMIVKILVRFVYLEVLPVVI